MDIPLLNILACPLCKGKLIYDHHAGELICTVDRCAYPLINDVPVMLPSSARQLKEEEY